jgi:hypothetical protein
MKVNIKHEEANKAYFHSLQNGQIFIYAEEAWMKICIVAEEADEDADELNAVRMEDGGLSYFYGDEVILPKTAELNIEY